MKTYRVRVLDLREQWATVKARDEQHARHLVLASAGEAEELEGDDFDDVEWDFPQPIDGIAYVVDGVVDPEQWEKAAAYLSRLESYVRQSGKDPKELW